MRSPSRGAVAAAGVVLALATAPAAGACVRIGVYQDQPTASFLALQHKVGKGLTTVSTYVTVGQPLDPRLVAFVNAHHLRLVVSWLPDAGKDGPSQPHYRLFAIKAGKFDGAMRTLVRQLRGVRGPVILRPMPEPNTPWYAWSGAANDNTPALYRAAWKHLAKVVRAAGGHKVKLLWTPYARSVPDTPQNAIKSYFPGKKQVDLVGADGYNFGSAHSLTWADPGTIFGGAYTTIEQLAGKPFWIGETGSTAKGGNVASWISSLGALPTTMPKLAGIVWYDVRDANGDFRVRQTAASAGAFKSLASRSCR